MTTFTASFSLTMDFAPFVLARLRPPPAHILEIGCGSGELARALSAARYEVVAVDPEAPEGEQFRRVSFEDFDEAGPFDAIVASRSLHHIHDLGAALDKVVRLLGEEGALLLDEFAWDRMDDVTAEWYYTRRNEPVDGWRERWEEEHDGLHTYEAMRRELDERFRERSFAWLPYLHRDTEADIEEIEERLLIEEGTIQATGFRYVGTPRA
jgi:SAM-dependent methyltransferase